MHAHMQTASAVRNWGYCSFLLSRSRPARMAWMTRTTQARAVTKNIQLAVDVVTGAVAVEVGRTIIMVMRVPTSAWMTPTTMKNVQVGVAAITLQVAPLPMTMTWTAAMNLNSRVVNRNIVVAIATMNADSEQLTLCWRRRGCRAPPTVLMLLLTGIDPKSESKLSSTARSAVQSWSSP